jgi:alkylhydroperoxidase family enzyme
MQLPIHTIDEAPAESRTLLEGIASELGVIPNLAATAATSPALLAGFDGLRRAVVGAKLDPVLREITGLAVGVAVDNHYGVAFHSTMLAGLGVDETDIDAMRRGFEPAEPVAVAVHAFAREAALGRGKVSESATQAVLDAGLSTETILEVLLEISFATTVGLIDNFAGHVELDGFLSQRRW